MNFNIAEINSVKSSAQVSNNNLTKIQIENKPTIINELAEAIEISEMISEEEIFEREEQEFTDKVSHYVLSYALEQTTPSGESSASSFLYFVKSFIGSIVGFLNKKKHKKRKKWLDKRKNSKKQ